MLSKEKEKETRFPPCVGCGYCCISTPCFRAAAHGWHCNPNRVCEKLFWDKEKGRYLCQEIIDNPEKMENLGVGFGCPSILGNDWRKNIKRRF